MSDHTFAVGDSVLCRGHEWRIARITRSSSYYGGRITWYILKRWPDTTLIVTDESWDAELTLLKAKPENVVAQNVGELLATIPVPILGPGAKVRLCRNYVYRDIISENGTEYPSDTYTTIPTSSIGKVVQVSTDIAGFCEVQFPGFRNVFVKRDGLEVLNENAQPSAVEHAKEFRLRAPPPKFVLCVDDMSEPP